MKAEKVKREPAINIIDMTIGNCVATVLWLFLASPSWATSLVPSDGIIASPGKYELASDRITAGRVSIHISADNVTLDLNGKAVRCNPNDPKTAITIGVKVSGGNVTVRNGSIGGCFMGGHAAFSSGNVSWERIDFTGNTHIGTHGGTSFVGNIFKDIRGNTSEPYAIGINAPANGCYIFGNAFRNLHRQSSPNAAAAGEGVGVLVGAGTFACSIESNWFENDELGPDRAIGVWVADGAMASISDNSFTNFGWAVAATGTASITDNRFWMRDEEAGSVAIATGDKSTVDASGNVIIGYDSPFEGFLEQSRNLILP